MIVCADAWKHDVVEDISSTSNDRGAEEGFRPLEVHELTPALYRDDTACRYVEVLVELCQLAEESIAATCLPVVLLGLRWPRSLIAR
jgi:hypothetical protein